MVNFNDIYFKVDSSIVEKGYWQLGVDDKKSLIDSELKNYALDKLKELGKNKILSLDDITVSEIVNIMGDCIPKEKHFDTLRHFIHYIIQVAGSIQEHSVVWWSEDDPKLKIGPIIEFDIDGKWNELRTHKEEDYTKTFAFVYDVFQNHFLSKTKYSQK